MTIIEWVLVVNLFISLYLAYRVYSTQSELEELEDLFEAQAEIIGRFINKIAKEKLDSGEWTPNETF